MMKKRKKIQFLKWFKKRDDGSANIELIVSFFVLLFLLSMFLNILPLFVKKQDLNYMAGEVVRMAEVTGGIDNPEVNGVLTELQDTTGITLASDAIDWTGTDFMAAPNDTRVQINGKIKLTLKSSYVLKGNTLGDVSTPNTTLPITSTSTGRSEVFLKVN